MAKQWMQDNWWKIAVAVVTIVAGYAVLTDNVRDMEPKVERNSRDIIEIEKDVIGVKGSIDALNVRIEAQHTESDKKLDAILDAVEP